MREQDRLVLSWVTALVCGRRANPSLWQRGREEEICHGPCPPLHTMV